MQFIRATRSSWLCWLALNHFMTAGMVRNLAAILVEEVSGGKLSLADLFDEWLVGNGTCVESWVTKPKPVTGRLELFLQNGVRNLVWQNDKSSVSGNPELVELTRIPPALIDYAINLGASDFKFSPKLSEELSLNYYPELASLDEALQFSKKVFELPQTHNLADLFEIVNNLPLILKATVLKHLGDLFVDEDLWQQALTIYSFIEIPDGTDESSDYLDYSDCLRSSTQLSISAARLALEGAGAKPFELETFAMGTKNKDPQIHVINGSLDEYRAKSELDNFSHDTRGSVLLAPALHISISLDRALSSWHDGQYQRAHEKFWALLRRQISLGLFTDVLSTKGYYAQCLIDGLSKNKIEGSANFDLGLRLLVESENIQSAQSIEWNESTVEQFVNVGHIELLNGYASSAPARAVYRSGVVVDLLGSWALKLPSNSVDIARECLRSLVRYGKMSESSIWRNIDYSTKALKAIKEIGKLRPEFCNLVEVEVGELVTSKFNDNGFWTGRAEAFELATEFSHAFSEVTLRNVLIGALETLDDIDPAKEFWVVVRPALNLITSQRSSDFAKLHLDLGERIIQTILRFGAQRTEYANVLISLHNFAPELLQSENVKLTLKSAIDEILAQANIINSSGVTSYIAALLVSPRLVGESGISRALDGIDLILASANSDHVSLGFTSVYNLLMHFSSNVESIAIDAAMESKNLTDRLALFFERITDIWKVASTKPGIFADFSFASSPPPNKTHVHNLAMAYLVIANKLNLSALARDRLKIAQENLLLKSGITLALASLMAEEVVELSAQDLENEGREEFYSNMGRRLIAVYKWKSKSVAEALLSRVLFLGPRPEDAAVLSAIVNLEITLPSTTKFALEDYRKRVDADRKYRLLLGPLLDLIG